ncbi:MAG: BAX inhibitor (BI)-1/YccA family protein [Rhodobacteraceae bacterium]|nr:BAX inhibitor (BI)-1/YccA family protein [Paracoccaceae bacterium]
MANNSTIRRAGSATMGAEIDAGLRAHMNKVYGLMSIAMAVTGAVAYGFGSTPALISLLINMETGSMNPLGWVVMFAPLGMVMFFGAAVNRLSQAGAQLFFYTFAALMGLSISWIFMVYTDVSIVKTFLITSIAFASLSLYGYTTKKDISAWGSFLIMGVFGLIIAMVVNFFMQSAALDFAISGLGVLIFAGLTAYDTQKIKTMYLQARSGGSVSARGMGSRRVETNIGAGSMDTEEMTGKLAIYGALTLYLDFINLFMFLLRFMGSRD